MSPLFDFRLKFACISQCHLCAALLLAAFFVLGLRLNPENEGDMFLRNVG
jgi:hypothetical protein